MTKAVALLFACLMVVQIIRPIGLPGLKQRKDAWKLAVFGFLAIGVALGIANYLRPA